MLINKKVILSGVKKCYFLFDLEVPLYVTTDPDDIPTDTPTNDNRTSMYNGSIRVFETLLNLNDHLRTYDITAIQDYADDKLYKGHLFSGGNFPLELPRDSKDYHIFIIEKIDSNTCFVEEVTTLQEITSQIEHEINSSCVIEEGKTTISTNTNINDFLIFIGKKYTISYHVIDSED